MVEEKELTQLATLARINLTAVERTGLINDLRAILDYVGQLKKVHPVKTQNLKVEPWETGPANVLRADGPPVAPAATETDVLLGAAPRTQGAYFKVKAVFGDKNGG